MWASADVAEMSRAFFAARISAPCRDGTIAHSRSARMIGPISSPFANRAARCSGANDNLES